MKISKMVVRKNKKILIATPFFYPELISTGKYNAVLAEKIVENGHDVSVICSYPLYPTWKPEFTSKTLANVKVVRGGLKMVYPKSAILRRLLLEIWFTWHFFKKSSRIEKPVDVVIAVSPPIIFTIIVGFLFKEAKKTIIVHDLMGVMATSSNSVFRKSVAWIMKRLESFLLQRCDVLICLSESMKEVLVRQFGLPPTKCQVFYPFAHLAKSIVDHGVLNDVFPAGFRHIVYSGAMGEKQKPKELYRFFKRLCEKRSDFCCHIFSNGPIVDELRSINSVKRICFHNLVPENQLSALYASSDIQVIPQAEGTGAGAFPSKLPNLISAGVPVLAICDKESELAKVVLEAEAGVVVSGWDFHKLNDAVDSLLRISTNMPRERRQVMAQKYVLEKFDVNRLIASIVN